MGIIYKNLKELRLIDGFYIGISDLPILPGMITVFFYRLFFKGIYFYIHLLNKGRLCTT